MCFVVDLEKLRQRDLRVALRRREARMAREFLERAEVRTLGDVQGRLRSLATVRPDDDFDILIESD